MADSDLNPLSAAQLRRHSWGISSPPTPRKLEPESDNDLFDSLETSRPFVSRPQLITSINRDLSVLGYQTLPVSLLLPTPSPHATFPLLHTIRTLATALLSANAALEECQSSSSRLRNDWAASNAKAGRFRKEVEKIQRVVEEMRVKVGRAEANARELEAKCKSLESEVRRLRRAEMGGGFAAAGGRRQSPQSKGLYGLPCSRCATGKGHIRGSKGHAHSECAHDVVPEPEVAVAGDTGAGGAAVDWAKVDETMMNRIRAAFSDGGTETEEGDGDERDDDDDGGSNSLIRSLWSRLAELEGRRDVSVGGGDTVLSVVSGNDVNGSDKTENPADSRGASTGGRATQTPSTPSTPTAKSATPSRLTSRRLSVSSVGSSGSAASSVVIPNPLSPTVRPKLSASSRTTTSTSRPSSSSSKQSTQQATKSRPSSSKPTTIRTSGLLTPAKSPAPNYGKSSRAVLSPSPESRTCPGGLMSAGPLPPPSPAGSESNRGHNGGKRMSASERALLLAEIEEEARAIELMLLEPTDITPAMLLSPVLGSTPATMGMPVQPPLLHNVPRTEVLAGDGAKKPRAVSVGSGTRTGAGGIPMVQQFAAEDEDMKRKTQELLAFLDSVVGE
ncbi:hypothetical protein HK104_011300 [Borealophlyctis nickersoniae]|nr:hypothetical protein HK104_011300 [Borealophlyctis nickersoniae]